MDFKLNTLFIRNRLARRVLKLFVFCALIPILVFTWYTYRQIELQMSAESQKRLSHLAKVMGMSIYERLVLMDIELSHVASGVLSGIPLRDHSEDQRGEDEGGFRAMALISQDGTQVPLLGNLSEIPDLPKRSDGDKSTILLTHQKNPGPLRLPRIHLCRLLDQGTAFGRWIVGEVRPEVLWGIGDFDNWPAMIDFCVLDPSDRVLASSLSEGRIEALLRRKSSQPGDSREFQWRHGDESYYAACWTMFLRSRFQTEDWSIILSQTEENIFSRLNHFKSIFILMTSLSLFLVLYLSVRFIQRSFIPLEHLREGTRRISRGDLNSPIVVKSEDEFEELAHSFNMMSTQLERQFRLLNIRSGMDRSLLRSFEQPRIARILEEGLLQLFEGARADVLFWNREAMEDQSVSGFNRWCSPDRIIEIPKDNKSSLARFFRINEYWLSGKSPALPKEASPFLDETSRPALILPVFSNLDLAAIVIIRWPKAAEVCSEDCGFARNLADQAGIALANIDTLAQLDRHNWGTMQALARAVDANSPWTAGHSERVARIAMNIAGHLHFSEQEMDTLHRGALLHDIGKLGIPPCILDKPGKLDAEEFEIIKSHPLKGASILEPIKSYADLIPIVSQHHERFDATGYPLGIGGHAIHWGARILAVADAFDAMVSDRPYRKGWSPEQAAELIRGGAGTQFDPAVVEAFFSTPAMEALATVTQTAHVETGKGAPSADDVELTVLNEPLGGHKTHPHAI